MPLYFAYGSNMDQAAMLQRCPASKPVGIGRLMRHRFIIFDEGYASVVRDPQRAVWGMVWDLALADVPALDRYESLSTGLYTKVIQPVVTEQGPRRAMVYIGRSAKPGMPLPGYMEGRGRGGPARRPAGGLHPEPEHLAAQDADLGSGPARAQGPAALERSSGTIRKTR